MSIITSLNPNQSIENVRMTAAANGGWVISYTVETKRKREGEGNTYDNTYCDYDYKEEAYSEDGKAMARIKALRTMAGEPDVD